MKTTTDPRPQGPTRVQILARLEDIHTRYATYRDAGNTQAAENELALANTCLDQLLWHDNHR